MDHHLPCAIAQGPDEILTVVERERGEWRGAQATWEGKCYIRPSCLSQNVDCQADALYFEDVNSCRVHVQILDRCLRIVGAVYPLTICCKTKLTVAAGNCGGLEI